MNYNLAEKGQQNFDRICSDLRVEFFFEIPFNIIPQYSVSSIDLLYLEASGKLFSLKDNPNGTLSSILKYAYPRLKSGAIVLIHDIFKKSFKIDAIKISEFNEDESFFIHDAIIGIYEMGLQFLIKK